MVSTLTILILGGIFLFFILPKIKPSFPILQTNLSIPTFTSPIITTPFTLPLSGPFGPEFGFETTREGRLVPKLRD